MVTPGRPDGHSKERKGIHEIYENQYYVFKYTGALESLPEAMGPSLKVLIGPVHMVVVMVFDRFHHQMTDCFGCSATKNFNYIFLKSK